MSPPGKHENFIGVGIRKVHEFLDAASLRDDGIWLLQELPRSQPGWDRKPKVCGTLTLMRYQGLDTWRGVGIAFDASKFCIRAKKACEHGIWILLQRVASKQCFWVGSC